MPNYTVKFPDGTQQTFSGPPHMTDEDIYQRAIQERDVASGKIQTTFTGGMAKAIGEDPTVTGAMIGGVGYATGQPAIVAAAPLAARGIQYATQRMTGQNPETPSKAELAVLAAVGAIPAVGPSIASGIAGPMARSVSQLPVSTLPQAIARGAVPAAETIAEKASAITPQAIGGVVSSLIDAAKKAGARLIAGVSVDDLELLREQIGKGMAPRVAAKVVSNGDPAKAASLLRIMRMP